MDTQLVIQLVKQALAEDIQSGDITAQLIPKAETSTATIIAREAAVICGCAFVNTTFQLLNPEIQIKWNVSDGDKVKENELICTLIGNSRDLLTGERTSLNFLQSLSSTASLTKAYVDAIEGTNCKVLDTRKTIPGLRIAQKYAVACGGGKNHRIGLFDAFLIKENHIMAAGSITKAVNKARELNPDLLLEVEVEDFEQLNEALTCNVKRILLDNFTPSDLKKAVFITHKRADLEASGNIDLSTIREIAETGVDYISTGAITKNIIAIDLSMRFNS